MTAFEITKEMIVGMKDEQLRQLLRRLLEAEARARNIPLSGIAVGGNQTAGDGGVDGSIAWTGLPNPEGWLPRRTVYFQSKAEVMAAAKLNEEMRPRGIARPIFAELAAVGGAYIVFSSDDPSKSSHNARLSAMRAALADVAGSDQIALDFYGADKIARWCNQHLGVALWLLEQIGRPLAGWRGYGAWSSPDCPGQPYLLDDAARATIQGRELSVSDAATEMREILSSPGGVVRLVGLSGMGKTRFAEALFDDCLDGTALPKERAVYGDAGIDLAVSAALMAEQIAVAGIEAVLVVDNCTQRTHGQLAEIVRRGNSRASLLTIDYDVLTEKPVGMLVTLGGNSQEILNGVLKQRFPKLSDAERRHLAEFSGGNARIALKIAEAGGKDVDLSKLKDSELLERLFQIGRQQRDPTALDCAEAASLVYAFYASAGDGHVVEYPFLSDLAGVPPQQFFRMIATFVDWGVVQQRGPQRAVMPPPLANMLAGPCIRRSDPDALVAKFAGAPPRLFASFARRIGQLHDEPAAIAIAERFFAAGGPLGLPVALDPLTHRAFIHAAPAAPEAALSAIERTLASGYRSQLLEPGAGRRDLTQLLVHLAHEKHLFGRAIDLLIVFTLADGDTGDEFKAAPHLLERFWPILSLTLADQDTRLVRIDRMLSDSDDRIRALGVEALDHMLDAQHFSSSLSLEFGAKARLKEWRPTNGAGYRAWFDAAYDRLIMIAGGGRPEAGRARDVIALHFREHYDSTIIDKTLEAISAVRGGGYWEHGWRAINDTLHFMHRHVGAEDQGGEPKLETLRALERDFRPKTLDDFFETFVLGEPWRHWHPNGNDRKIVRSAGALARAVGRAMTRRNVSLSPYLERAAIAVGANSVGPFMAGLAKSSSDLDALWDAAYARFIATERGNPALLAGLLEGAYAKHRDWVERKLDAIVADTALSEHLVTLHAAVPLDATAVERFSTAIARGVIPVARFSRLMMGSVTKPLPGTVLAGFLRVLFAKDGGKVPALQILHMRFFGDRSDKVPIDPALIEVGREILGDERIYAQDFRRQDHDIAEIAKIVFVARKDSGLARTICIAMRENATNGYVSSHDFRDLAQFLMGSYPSVVYEEIVEKSTNKSLIERFFGELADDDDDKMLEPEADFSTLLQWVTEDPQPRALKVAQAVRYITKDSQSGQLRWSALALALIEVATDPGPVLRVFEQRFFTGVGWGPFSLRFVRRRPLVAAMLQSSNPAAQSWAREAGLRIEENIKRWDETDRDYDSRFE